MSAYGLSLSAEFRCQTNQFFLQESPKYKGYTEKIFRVLHVAKKPLTVDEIHEITGIPKRSIWGTITFNLESGYIVSHGIVPDRNVSISELRVLYQQILNQYFR